MKKEQKRKILFYGILAGTLLLFAACAAHLAPYDPYEQNLELSLLPPSAAHWMGTDRYGRDLFSRILSGARVSIFSALLVVAASALIGTLAGIFSGWLEGKTDTVLMQISDIFLAFPGMVFAIAFSGVLQSGMAGAVVSLILVSWPKYARLARNRVLALKHMPFIAAARLTGNGTWKMIGRHILPNLAGQTIVTAVLDIGTMMMELAGLSFLGLGVKPPMAEWGSMINDGRSMLQISPWMALSPGLAIFVTVMIFNLLGDTLRDFMDPKERAKKVERKYRS